MIPPEAHSATLAFILFLFAQRICEVFYSNGNTRRLKARGAVEYGAAHYPLLVLLHLFWLTAIAGFGWLQPLHLGWLSLFALLQLARLWVLITLGPRWTTRIIVLNEPLIRQGPYRWLAHPNYAVVTAEIFVAPMALGLWRLAILASVLNLAVLMIRIKAENAALRQAHAAPQDRTHAPP